MRLLAFLSSLFALQVTRALANTEKVIFLAPDPIALPDSGPTLQALGLDTLSPEATTLKTALPVHFPSSDRPRGYQSWYLLQGLKAGQRYEVRVCWPAVQPTEFWLETFNLTHVFDTPHLIESLAAFAEEKSPSSPGTESAQDHSLGSVLFLRVDAAADYFTTNKTLMVHPTPVDVDIILDPYLGNIFPASLVSTAVYIAVLAVLAFFLSGQIWSMSTPSSSHTGGSSNQSQGVEPDDLDFAVMAEQFTALGAVVCAEGLNEETSLTTARPRHPFYRLPSELILDIVDLLPAEAFINFAFANYPLLHSYGVAPTLSRTRVIYITTRTALPALFPLLRMPAEIMLHIMRNLKPIDIMRFVVANYQDLARQGIAPPMTPTIENELRNVVRARLGRG
ncbi:Putative F-box domain, GPI-Mannosyltransferase II co-activator, Pga1 [Septoria linicola]|uniref:F-box domain, GPI-Mannosyltransferase II co-activator, Pga1 n=1 Tax=Septoria linicola TaxID=215465 RepID=A0A9Q9AIQ4_9PEZI|nr:Putative F-box domain, GPI-Mannosyltransferase II co-activator, Pga1 [Septoria linicola]